MLVSETIELKEGFITFYQVDDFADIHHIEVGVPYRGQGYGTYLMTLFLTEMKKRKVTEVTLEVRLDNQVAIHLYEKFEFERVHVRKAYYQDGCDALLMRGCYKNRNSFKY